MKKSKLISLLSIFSKEEMKRFEKFIASPYFNNERNLKPLYKILKSYHPSFDNLDLTEEKLFKKLYPGKVYDKKSAVSIRTLESKMYAMAETFLPHNRLEKDNLEYSVILENELRIRKQFNLMEKIINRSAEYLKETELDSDDYLYYKYRFEDEKISYLVQSNYAAYEKILDKLDWENVFKDFTNYYHIKSMMMYLNALSIHKLYNKDFKSRIFTNMISKIVPEEYEDVPIITVYYYILKMFTNMHEESHFYKVKELVRKNKSIFSRFDLSGSYIYLNQYCKKKISEGESKFEKESFEIYKEELNEKTYLMNDSTMAPVFYRNIVNAGLGLKELSWVKNFIYKYKAELNKSYRENYFNWCLAHYEFHSGNFEISMELNSKIKHDEIYMKLSSKALQMQLLYETDNDISLISYLDSFKHFLNNDKLLPAKKKSSYSNFHKYLNKIILYKNKKHKSEKDFIRKNLLKDNDVYGKTWLLEKIKII